MGAGDLGLGIELLSLQARLGFQHGDAAVLFGAHEFGAAGQFLLPDPVLGQTPHQSGDEDGGNRGAGHKKTNSHGHPSFGKPHEHGQINLCIQVISEGMEAPESGRDWTGGNPGSPGKARRGFSPAAAPG